MPNQGHYFNADSLYKRFTPAGPDHAQVAACAGLADYIDDVYAHHSSDDTDPRARGHFVHDLFRAHEVELLQPLLDYCRSKNSIRLLGPTDAAIKAPTVALSVQGECGCDCWRIIRAWHYGRWRRFLRCALPRSAGN